MLKENPKRIILKKWKFQIFINISVISNIRIVYCIMYMIVGLYNYKWSSINNELKKYTHYILPNCFIARMYPLWPLKCYNGISCHVNPFVIEWNKRTSQKKGTIGSPQDTKKETIGNTGESNQKGHAKRGEAKAGNPRRDHAKQGQPERNETKHLQA